MHFISLLCLLFFSSGPTGAVNGFVRDSTNGEPLGYANVEIKGTGQGTITNSRGYFYLGEIAPGTYQLEVTFIGYAPFSQRITVAEGKLTSLNIELKPAPVPLGEVQVTAERARFEREVEISSKRLDTRQLVLVPKLGGEVDIMRTVQLLPGVITVSDFSNKLYIRGGSPDQNLILLDGITVYNPSHLFGIFSPFVPEAVADVNLLAGGFPAQYGSRLSSVLDVTTREGNSKRYTGEASVSMIAAKAIAEGPIPNGSILIAGRRTYLPDVLLKLLGVAGLNYYFYDLIGKANYQLNDNYRLHLAGLGAEDALSFWDPEQPDAFRVRLTWGNRGVSARCNAIFNPVFYGEIMGAWSNFFSKFRVSFEPNSELFLNGDLTSWNLKGNFTWYPLEEHTLGFGLDLQSNRMGLRIDLDTTRFNTEDTLLPIAGYFEDKWEVFPKKLFIRPGLRLAYYSKGSRLEPEPRLGVKLLADKNTALNLALGRFTQPLVTLNSTDPVFSIYDVWVPVPESRKNPSAYHYIGGIEHWFKDDLLFQVEAYFKDYNHLLENRYGDYFTRPESLLAAEGFSSGVELLIRKSAGPINGWFAYSFMWTERSINGETYHPHYDRRHNLNLILNLPALLLGTDLTLRWTLGSGLPYSGLAGYYPRVIERPGGKAEMQWDFIYGRRDAFRYPVYHRLDAGLTKTGKIGRFEVSILLDIINLYNARNVLLYYWEFNPSGIPERHQINMIPILPTLGVKVKF
ncbi:MAG: TonB-dependent receptor [bacterium]